MDTTALKEGALATYRVASDRDLTYLAAGFAYYAFVSVIPLVLLALVVGSLVGGEAMAERLVLLAGDYLPQSGEALVVDAMTTESGRAEATVVALVVAAWGALKVFRGLSLAFDRIYGTDERDSLLEQIEDGVVAILSGAGGFALMIAVGAALRLLPGAAPLLGVAGWLVLLLGLFVVFLPMYVTLPPIDVSVREAIPGAALAAVGWVLLQGGFQLYAANAAQYEAYGAVGAILLFVTWLYFAGILLLLGAVVNVVVSRPDLAA